MPKPQRTVPPISPKPQHYRLSVLDPIKGPELVIGLVGPLGANLTLVSEILQNELSVVDYQSEIIQVSSLLHEIKQYHPLKNSLTEEKRINKHMDYGNKFRHQLRCGDALARIIHDPA